MTLKLTGDGVGGVSLRDAGKSHRLQRASPRGEARGPAEGGRAAWPVGSESRDASLIRGWALMQPSLESFKQESDKI